MNMGYFIVVVTTVVVIALHVGLYWKIRRWMDRDLALSFGGDDADKRAYLLRKLEQARTEGVRRRDLPVWLEQAAAEYPGQSG